jgi:hypothetical protein
MQLHAENVGQHQVMLVTIKSYFYLKQLSRTYLKRYDEYQQILMYVKKHLIFSKKCTWT